MDLLEAQFGCVVLTDDHSHIHWWRSAGCSSFDRLRILRRFCFQCCELSNRILEDCQLWNDYSHYCEPASDRRNRNRNRYIRSLYEYRRNDGRYALGHDRFRCGSKHRHASSIFNRNVRRPSRGIDHQRDAGCSSQLGLGRGFVFDRYCRTGFAIRP